MVSRLHILASDDFWDTPSPSGSDRIDSMYQSYSSVVQFSRLPGKRSARVLVHEPGFLTVWEEKKFQGCEKSNRHVISDLNYPLNISGRYMTRILMGAIFPAGYKAVLHIHAVVED